MAKIKTQAAQAAKEIKQLLQKNFPLVKFSVKSENYSGGNSVNVWWNFGPNDKTVDSLIEDRQHGHFDGMTDTYHYTGAGLEVSEGGNIKEKASAKYVFANRCCKPNSYTYTALRGDIKHIHERIAFFFDYEFINGDWQPKTGWQGVHQTRRKYVLQNDEADKFQE